MTLGGASALRVLMAVLLLACHDGQKVLPVDARVGGKELRVSAVHGLPNFVPSRTPTGTSAAAMELAYEHASVHLEAVTIDGSRVVMRRRPSSLYGIKELASALVFRELKSATVLDEQHIEAHFIDAESATEGISLDLVGLSTGLFQAVSASPKEVVLRRRDASNPISIVRLVGMDSETEWRLFSAGELDVAPSVGLDVLGRLDSVPHATAKEMVSTHELSLVFNVKQGPFVDLALRRFVSCKINRRGLVASMGFPVAAAAADPLCSDDDATRPNFTKPLRFIYLKGGTLYAQTAVSLKYLLGEAGVPVELIPLDINELVSVAVDGRNFDISLLPIPHKAQRYERFASAPKFQRGNLSGFASAAYDEAFERGDMEEMDRLLEELVPYSPLYRDDSFVVLSEGWCLDPSLVLHRQDWRWLGSVTPCLAEDS